MNNNFAEFLIKVLGILSFLKALSFLQPLIDTFSQKNLNIMQDEVMSHKFFLYSISGISVSMTVFLLTGIILIKYAPIITNHLSKKDEPENRISEHSIQAVCFSLIGVYLLTTAISQIAFPIAEYSFLKGAGNSMPAHSVWANVAANSIQAIIGLLLFFGAKGLSSLWYFFQDLRPMSADKTT